MSAGNALHLYVPHLGWLQCPPGDDVARFLAEGWFEYREQAFCRLYLRKGETVLDGGAHFGLYAALGASIGCRVLAIEPNPETGAFLETNLKQYGGERVAAALGSSGPAAEQMGRPSQLVRRVTVDSLLRERGVERAALLKIDVEGDAIEVLRGARASILAGALPLLMVECAEPNLERRGVSTRALFDELVGLGYTVCRFDAARRALAPVEWTGPVCYDNYFAAMSPSDVNRRLAEPSAEQSRIADDILRRGAAATEMRQAAIERDKALRRLEAERAEAVRRADEATSRLDEARRAAEAAGRRAQEASSHLEESWRHIGEANWRADQAAIRGETAGQRSESAYRRLDAADRRAANARDEADLFKTRLREILLHPRLANASMPGWVEPFLAATEDLSPPAPIASGHVDPMERALYHLTGKNLRPRVILDAGAGRGYWSMNAQSFFPDAEFYLADPLDEHEEDLRNLCSKDTRFHFLKTAIGAADGSIEINVTADLYGSYCLPHPGADAARRRTIPLRAVDSLIAEGCLAPPDLIKIDVQGYEREVIAGAAKALETAEALIVEVSLYRFMPDAPLAHEVIADLASRGFLLFDLAGSLRRPFEDDLGQLDLVFVSGRSRLVESSRWT